MVEAQRCHLGWQLLPDGSVDLTVSGHILPSHPALLARLRETLIHTLDDSGQTWDYIAVAVPITVVVHLTPEEARRRVNQAGSDLAYLMAAQNPPIGPPG